MNQSMENNIDKTTNISKYFFIPAITFLIYSILRCYCLIPFSMYKAMNIPSHILLIISVILGLLLFVGLFIKGPKLIVGGAFAQILLDLLFFMMIFFVVIYFKLFDYEPTSLIDIYTKKMSIIMLIEVIFHILSYCILGVLVLKALNPIKGWFVKKMWILPLIFNILSYILLLYMIIYFKNRGESLEEIEPFIEILSFICEIIPFIMISIWVKEEASTTKPINNTAINYTTESIPVPNKQINYTPANYTTEGAKEMNSNYSTNTPLKNLLYKDFTPFVLLLIFTLGIYCLYWTYKVTEALNIVKDEPYRKPATNLLLCMFCPFYYIYWTYKTALLTDKLAKEHGISSDLGVICLIFSIFIPIIPPIFIQDKLNSIALKSGQPQSVSYTQQNTQNMDYSSNNDDLPDL